MQIQSRVIFCFLNLGVFDNCLFSVHKPQLSDLVVDQDTRGSWAKLSHLKLNGLPIDHFKAGATGPLSWIKEATIDMDLHLLFPQFSTSEDALLSIRNQLDSITKKVKTGIFLI